MQSGLKSRWIIITGASSGFGAAIAQSFAAHGSRLLLGARREDRLRSVAQNCLSHGAETAEYFPLDVSSSTSVTAFFRWVAAKTEKADVLVNNAGGALGLDPVAEGKDEDWETMMQTNVLGVLRVTRASLPLLKSNPGSSIINIGSIAGHVAYEGGAAYCAAKAGERKITEALRLELNGTGVRVSTIDPGMAETEFSLVRFKGDLEKAKKVYEGVCPLTATDVAEAVLWVASRPAHVNIDEMVIKPTDQAAIHKINRRKS